jgi:hypothetical protein
VTRPLDATGAEPSPSGHALVATLAATGAPGTDAPVPPRPLDDARWSRFLRQVEGERLEPLLAHAASTGAWPVTDVQLAEALARGRRALALVLELERELIAVHDDLRAEGIPMRVLKGPAIARLDEEDPSCRAFGDIDVLVRPRDVRRAVAVVQARGGTRRYATRSAAYDRYVGKGVSFRFERNVEVDLHRTIAPGPFGIAVDLDELFARSQPVPVGPVTIQALDRPGRFLHACYHAALGRARPRRSAQRDIVLTAPLGDRDLDEVVARARRWRGELVVASAVTSVVDDLCWQPPGALASWVAEPRTRPASPRERRWLEAYRSDERSSRRLTLLGAGVGGGAARARYLVGLATGWPGARREVSGGRRRRSGTRG